MPTPEHIIRPIERDPDALVENVYPYPGTVDMPDLESSDRMAEFLMERFAPDEGPRIRIGFVETGKTLPRLERPIVDYKEGTKIERDGWIIHPYVTVGLALGSLAIVNGYPAVADAAEEIAKAEHAVYRVFHPVKDELVVGSRQVEVNGPVRHITVKAGAGNTPGSVTVNQEAVSEFSGRLARVIKKGGKIKSITITGRSSDDYGTNDSIGRPEPAEQDSGDERAEAYSSVIQKVIETDKNGYKHTKLITKVDQNVLTPAEKALVEQAAEDAGFTGVDNIIDAIHSVNAGQANPKRLERLINKLFTSKRGVTLEAAVNKPGEKSEKTVPTLDIVPGVDNPPEDNDHDYHFWPFTLPPIPRLRRTKGALKPVRKFRIKSGVPIMTPTVIKETVEKVWLRIRSEAVADDDTLLDDAWAYTRFYEHVLKDDRIADVLRADFKDREGKSRSLRIMFVDKSPAPHTIEAFSDLLTKFASLQNGTLPDKVNAIFVYPSENAGTWHRDPKRIGLGGDKQAHENILGTYTYPLKLVEMHMDTSTWDPAELEEMFHSFEGPRWTLAHEVGGHGTDVSNEPMRLRRAHIPGIPNAHLLSGNPRAERMKPLDSVLQRLPRSIKEKLSRPIAFSVRYRMLDNNDNTVTTPAQVVLDNDPMLGHATEATIIRHKPTRYADASTTEHYAETAAAVITGDSIDFTEATVTPPQPITDDGQPAAFTTGYRPDIQGQALYTRAVGAKTGSYPIEFDNPVEVAISHVAPANDPVIRQHMMRARRQQTLLPENMIAILARIARNAAGK